MPLDKPYLDVPGTTIFDAEQSRKGYWLNQFCMSLMKAENRARFKANERAYLDEWAMTEEQKAAALTPRRIQTLSVSFSSLPVAWRHKSPPGDSQRALAPWRCSPPGFAARGLGWKYAAPPPRVRQGSSSPSAPGSPTADS